MGMKASEVGNGVRRMAGKRDHREVLGDDYLALRPGPNFDWLMGNLAAGQPTPAASETDPAGNNIPAYSECSTSMAVVMRSIGTPTAVRRSASPGKIWPESASWAASVRSQSRMARA